MGKKYGITDLDALKKRCLVDPDSGCWTWGGAQVALAHRPLQVWLPHLGRTQSIQRAAWILARGPIKQGRIVWCTCGTQDCANPAELNPDPTATWEECMRADIRAICDCTHMAMLPGWQGSRGARLERSLARRLGLVVDELHVMLWLPRDEQRRAA